MNTNSNSYTIIYASVMVVIVAFLLAFVSSSLKDIQNKNQELDTKKQILSALNIRDVKDADAEYTKYVVPVYGAGLWGAIWGYVALNADKDTVYGVYFSHASETPGLGAEIAGAAFQNEFSGKKVLKDGQVALAVEKNGKVTDPAYQVDGISGGTITSKGVDAMIKACLSQYDKFLTNN